MGKISFVFSGQGAQFPGMGKDLYDSSPAARQVFGMAEAVRPGTIEQCFHGTAEQLSITENTQPCLFAMELAAARALEEAGVMPDLLAGFSLGEITALTFARVFESDEAGFRFVCVRAAAMQQAARKNPGAMAAVLKLENAQVEEICAQFAKMYPVNYNCPGQLVVAGAAEEMADFIGEVTAKGGKAVPLAVSGGFHSPFMQPAALVLSQALAELSLGAPVIPLYANINAQPYPAQGAAGVITEQVKSPVRWQQTIENMAQAGTDLFIEIGPGKTLAGLIKKTVKGSATITVQDMAGVHAAAEEVTK